MARPRAAEPPSCWSLKLFKRRFRIEVAEGYISQVKLRCDKGYLYFAFDPKLRYTVDDKYGVCMMELLGAPGAKFTLFQFRGTAADERQSAIPSPQPPSMMIC